MTVKLFKSTDASAPVLTGAVGSLVALLSAVLVDGYGAIAAAGWTKPYTATNKAVFRNDTSTGTGFYLDVDDNAPATAKEARVRGYETMSAVATGTNPFPTVAQSTNGIFVRKSNTADATARPWYIVADETVFYLWVDTNDYTVPTRASAFAFGDYFSFKTSDAYRCMIIGKSTENSSTGLGDNFPVLNALSNVQIAAQTILGHYTARGYAGVAGSVAFGVHANNGAMGTTTNVNSYPLMGNGLGGGYTYPNAADSGLILAPAFIHHNGSVRGYMKGIWSPSHDNVLGHTDTFSGTGAMSAKTFLAMQMFHVTTSGSISNPAQCAVETSNTWS